MNDDNVEQFRDSGKNQISQKINTLPITPDQTPLNSDRKDTLKTLDDKFILKSSSADEHSNVSSINLSGQIFKNVETENFEKFTSCAFIQASRTEGSINLDTFDKLENLSDLEINMSGISMLNQPKIETWGITILDLSYNNLSEAVSHNFQVLSSLQKLRVLNVSGNDLLNFGDSGEPLVFESLQLLIAENNDLSEDFFHQISTEVNMPNLKVLLLDQNRIKNIPKIEIVPDSLQNELSILSLAKNPIKTFENFSNVLQFGNLNVLKLQETPFVRTTSKNPKVVDDSGIVVERHYTNEFKKKQSEGPRNGHISMRKIAEPKRPKRDKTWFYELIENLEKRVKYEVRSAILGDEEIEGSEKDSKNDKNIKNDEKLDDPLTCEPVFLTELDNQSVISEKTDCSENNTIINSEISETITDMSILNGSEYSDSRGIETPPLPMSDTVKRLKMAYQKQTMIHQNHGLTKFPYKVNNNNSKVSNNNSLMIKSKTGESSEQKIVKSSLKSIEKFKKYKIEDCF